MVPECRCTGRAPRRNGRKPFRFVSIVGAIGHRIVSRIEILRLRKCPEALKLRGSFNRDLS
jgi:hypothetical protein